MSTNFKKYIFNYLKADTSRDFAIKIPAEKGIAFAKRIEDAVMKNKKITIYGDYDVDGILSTIFMYEMIRDFADINKKKPKITFKIPSRAEHYGLKYDFFKMAIKKNDLMITVDNGTHKDFFSKLSDDDKKKLLIVDHHPNGDFSSNKNVINPNTDGSVAISTGILIDFIHQALRSIDKHYANKRPQKYFRDLTAITLISDMANKNNKIVRSYIKDGLEVIKDKRRPIYDKMMPEWSDITSENLAFGLIPKLNSIGRLGLDLDWILDVFLETTDSKMVRDGALKLEDTNEQRKEITNYYAGVVEAKLKEQGVNLETTSLIYAHLDDVPIGINGILAGLISQRYKTNAFFTSINYGGDMKAVGSGRGDDIKREMIRFVNEYPEVSEAISFGGHLKAIGLRTENPDLLMEKSIEYGKTHRKNYKDESKHLVSTKTISIKEYKKFCADYQGVCGVVPLSDSFFVKLNVLVLGFDEYRNDFVNITCQDENGSLIDFVAKKTDINLLSEDFMELAVEIKPSKNTNITDGAVFTTVANPNDFVLKENLIEEISEEVETKVAP